MNRCMRWFVAIFVAGLLGACAAAPPRMDDPDVIAVTRQGGKGTPNGRSDSDEPFIAVDLVATDAGYGHTPADPIKLGGAAEGEGPQRQRQFLNGLRGPDDEPIAYERLGSCCPFETPQGFEGVGLLDMFELRIDGRTEPVHLYISIYDEDAVSVPVGLLPRRGAR
jgi:hypothetical protein